MVEEFKLLTLNYHMLNTSTHNVHSLNFILMEPTSVM